MKINSKNRGFVEGTLVLMADGKQKPIEQIKTGDYVLSFDEFNASAPLEVMEVTNTFSRIDNNILEINFGDKILKVAKDQMFIGPHNDWKEVYNHSMVVDVDGNPVEYTVSNINKGKHKVYDITVDINHSLIANGIRVHNIALGGAAGAGNSQAKQASPGGGGSSPRPSGNTTTTTNNNNTRSTNSTGGGATSSRSPNTARDPGSSRSNPDASFGSGNNGSDRFQTVDNGTGGRKKKSSKAPDEPTPKKPSGPAVAIKLMQDAENNVDVLQELIETLTPIQLTTAKITIQTGVDSIYSSVNNYVAAIYASELSPYDKTELIQLASSIMSTTAELRDPFEETVVSAAGKKMAIIYLSLMEANMLLSLEKLGVETISDGRGSFSVSINGRQTSSTDQPVTYNRPPAKPTKQTRYTRGSDGRYSNRRRPRRKVRSKSSHSPARSLYD